MEYKSARFPSIADFRTGSKSHIVLQLFYGILVYWCEISGDTNQDIMESAIQPSAHHVECKSAIFHIRYHIFLQLFYEISHYVLQSRVSPTKISWN